MKATCIVSCRNTLTADGHLNPNLDDKKEAACIFKGKEQEKKRIGRHSEDRDSEGG